MPHEKKKPSPELTESVRVPKDAMRLARMYAKERGMKLGAVIDFAIRGYVKDATAR